jgi:hypothetical protein
VIPKRKLESYSAIGENIDYKNQEYKKVKHYEVCKTKKKFGDRDFILIEIIRENLCYKLTWADLRQYEDYSTIVFEEVKKL